MPSSSFLGNHVCPIAWGSLCLLSHLPLLSVARDVSGWGPTYHITCDVNNNHWPCDGNKNSFSGIWHTDAREENSTFLWVHKALLKTFKAMCWHFIIIFSYMEKSYLWQNQAINTEKVQAEKDLTLSLQSPWASEYSLSQNLI